MCVTLDKRSAQTQGGESGQNFFSGFCDPFWIACVFVTVLSGNAPQHSAFC